MKSRKNAEYLEIEKAIESNAPNGEIYEKLDNYYACGKISKGEYFELLSHLDISE